MRNITGQTKSQCSGCGACLAVCGASAVSIRFNRYGFYQAFVDERKCIDCGRCRSVCVRFSGDFTGSDIRDANIYALQSSNLETVQRCSSGGIAHEIAIWALKHDYLLCGAVYDLSTNTVKHIITDNAALLDGSKYLQSNVSVFAEVIQKAQNGQRFAVFGVPCQITGIAKAAEVENCRDKLMLVEVFCHGVPTYKLWTKECERVRKKVKCASFDEVQFRYKKNGWHSYCLKVTAKDRTYYGSREKDLFYRVFFDDIVLNHSCMVCQVRKEQSLADIRLGDYWGRRFNNRDDGISAVFCNTPFSSKLISELPVKTMRAGDAEEILSCQNMKGYSLKVLHKHTLEIAASEGIERAIRYYQYRLPIKRKAKNILLSIFGFIPDAFKQKIKRLRY